MSAHADLVRLLRLAAPFWAWMLLAALLGLLTIASSIGLMSAAAWIIASAALQPHISTLDVAIVGVRFFGIARGVFRYAERTISHETTFRLLARLRVWFYQGIEPLAPARLSQHRSGDLLARAVADINTLENVYLRVIAPPLIALFVATLMFGFMAAHDLRLALALLAYHALAGVGLPLLVQRWGRDTGQAILTLRSDLTAQLVDGVQGLADLLAFGAEARHLAHLAAIDRALARRQRRMARLNALHGALLSLLSALAAITVLALAIPQVRAGRLDGVLLAVLVLAALASFEAVQPLPAAFQHLGANLAAARRLFELVDHPPPAAATAPVEVPGAVGLDVRDLRFRYAPGDPPALDGVSFALPPGRVLAVVGSSGAGKSTLVNVLLRFWEGYEGEARLAGRDLRAYDPDEARALISVVSQNTYLFTGSLRDNLCLARPHASDAGLWLALDRAQLGDFVRALPAGLDTWIGEQGFTLSGGERQRVAIARAVLKDAPLLILDEPTANLDPLTERAVLQAVFEAFAGRTLLIITHRLVGLERADEILVLEAGRIVEHGTQADLLGRDGFFRRLWAQQADLLGAITEL